MRPLRRTYYNLLSTVFEAPEEEAAKTLAAIEQVQAAVRTHFGSRFEVINDFYSYRSAATRLFPSWHQDYEFWLTGNTCSNFNLWVLLDHHGMNYSFDVYEVERNPWLYESLYSAQLRSSDSHRGGERNRTGKAATPRVPILPMSYFRANGRMPTLPVAPPAGSTHEIAQLPLDRGEALVLRQPEIHRTDRHPLTTSQWRLGIGFKVLERAPLVRLPLPESPFAVDLRFAQMRWPGLIPRLRRGSPFPSVYNLTSLRAYKTAPESLQTLVTRTAEQHPFGATIGALTVPTVLIALLAMWCYRAEQRLRNLGAGQPRGGRGGSSPEC